MKGLIRALCLGSAMMLFVSSVAQTIATHRLADSHSYDDASRLTGITYPSTATNSFGYNAFGARVSKTDSGGSFTFARAGASSGSAILSDGSAAYTPGISERRSSVSRFYHFGAQGENGRETASNESTASSRTWDAWGNPLSATGSTNSPFGAFGGSGSETEGDSGLIYSGEGAFYDPSIGRFIVSVSRSSPGGGYASFGDGGSNNPVAAPLVPAADGGGYVVGPSPRREYYGMLSGRLGYYGGSMEKALDHLLDAGVYAATETFEIVTSVLAVGALASLVDDAIRGIVSIGSRASRQPSASRVAQIAKDACFVAGTMILMADGSKKPIEEIQPGDLVLSRDEATGKTEAKEVVRVFERESNALVVIRLANGEEIKTTPEHPFWVEGKGWTIAGDLKAVDRLTTTSSTSSISTIQWHRTPSKVYNFEVKDFHTYFVSAGGTDVWVHNDCFDDAVDAAYRHYGRDPKKIPLDMIARDKGKIHEGLRKIGSKDRANPDLPYDEIYEEALIYLRPNKWKDPLK